MATFNNRNMVIFDDDEVQYAVGGLVGLVVVIRSNSPTALNEIDRHKIKEALMSQIGVDLPINRFSQYLCEYW